MVVFGSDRLLGRAVFALVIALAIGAGDLKAQQQREPPPRAGEANVVEVRLEGNSTTLNKLGFRFATRAGQPFDPKLVEDDVRSLDRTRRFLDIRPKYQRVPAGIVVIFSVVERPMIRKVKYVGNKVSSKILAKQAELKPGEALDPHMIEDARRRVERYYHEKGFAKANVTTLKGEESGEVVFLINEGTKQRVFWAQFEGNTIATDARLRTQILSKPGILWFIGGYVDPKKIEEDEDRITAYYRSLGFFQAKVGRLLDYDEDREWLTITYVINEGIRYKVRNVSVIGNKKFPSEEIASKLEMKGGQYFDQMKLKGDESYIRDLYGGQGHIFADVQADTRFVEEPGQEGLVDLVYNIGEGDRYRVGRIYVRINGEYPHTKQRTVINRLSLRSGDIVDTRLLRADEVRLKRSGLFINDPTKGQVPKIAIIPPEGLEDGEQLAKRPRGSTAGRTPTSRGFRGQSPDAVWPRDRQAIKPAVQRDVAGNELIDLVVDGRMNPQGPWQGNDDSPKSPPKYRAQDEGYGGAALGATGPTGRPASHYRSTSGAQQTVYYDSSMASTSGAAGNGAGTSSSLWKQAGASETNPGATGASPSDGPRYFDPHVTPAQFAPWPPGNANYLPPNGGNTNPAINFTPPGGNIAPSTTGAPAYVGTPASTPGPGVIVQPNAVVLPEGIAPDGVGYQVFPGNEPAIDLEAVVTEAQTGRLMFGVGVNSNAGLIGNIVLDEQNFDITKFPSSWEDFRNGTAWRGAGQRFRVEAAPGTNVSRYAVSFQEPYLFDRPVSFGINGSYYQRFYRDWHEERTTGRVSFGYQFPYRPDLSLTTGLRVEQVTITDPVFPTPPELLEVLGSNNVFGVKVGLVHDTRDSPFLPTEGFLHSFEFEQVFGSFTYPRFIAEASRYFTITQRPDGSGRHVLKVGGEFGITAEDTPIYDMFFAGGFNTLRGWKFRGASPRTFGVAVGGPLELLGTVEYMFPITADDMLRGVVFADFGTVEREFELEGDNFRLAPGFGMRITVPALGPAPLAFDFAFPILEAPGDDNQVFAFFVGINR